MFKIKINRESRPAGYISSADSWYCPLCSFRIYPDLMPEYVSKKAQKHMIKKHNAQPDRLKIVVETR